MIVTANCADHTLSIVELDSTVKSISVGKNPKDVVVGGGRFIYVSNSQDNTISVFDTKEGFVTHSSPIFNDPRGMALSPDHRVLDVVNRGNDTVSRIDLQNLSLIESYQVGRGPRNIRRSLDGTLAFVTNNEEGTLSIIQERAVRHIPLHPKPYGLCLAADWVCVTSIEHDCLCFVDWQKGEMIHTVPVGKHPTSVVFDARKGLLYTTNLEGDSLSIVHLEKLVCIKEVAVGKNPYGSALSADGNHLLITNNGEDRLEMVETEHFTVVRSFRTGRDPHGITIDAAR